MSGNICAAQPQPLPRFDVQLRAPDIRRWLRGNTGIAGFTSFAAPAPGPHVLLLALTHGNEIAGAIALDRLLAAGSARCWERSPSASSIWPPSPASIPINPP